MSRVSVAALVAALAFAAPAEAADVTRVRLGSSIENLVVGTDGGAWVQIFRDPGNAIGRALPDGTFSTAGIGETPEGATLGPDGQAWFKLEGRVFLRSDAAGRQTTVRLPGARPVLGAAIVAGPDATLWAPTAIGDRIAHVTAEGALTYTPTGLPECLDVSFTASGNPTFEAMRQASDGALWILDTGCRRLLRVSSTGTAQFAAEIPVADGFAPDAAGGVWFGGDYPGHADAAGHVRFLDLPKGRTTDVAVAADGAAWFATGKCRLVRVAADGAISVRPTPVPARRLAFDPSGTLWLASRARLVRLAPGEAAGPCDQTAPRVRVNGGSQRITLRQLRRGVRIEVHEPVALSTQFDFYTDNRDSADVGRRERRTTDHTVRVHLDATRLRRVERQLKRHGEAFGNLNVIFADREGNRDSEFPSLRVRR